jgi:hypothetical protein
MFWKPKADMTKFKLFNSKIIIEIWRNMEYVHEYIYASVKKIMLHAH